MRYQLASNFWVLATALASALVWSQPPKDDYARMKDLRERPIFERGTTWSCRVEITHYCNKERCETKRAAGRQYALDFVAQTIRVCDETKMLGSESNCSEWEKMEFGRSEMYTFVRERGQRGFVNILNDGSEFFASESFLGASILRFGKCERR